MVVTASVEVRAALEAERDDLLRRLRAPAAVDARVRPGGSDTADTAHALEQREHAARERHLAARRLATVSATLERITQAGWGVCEDCGDLIVAARMRALPEATRCRDCQARAETRGTAEVS